MTGNDIKGDVQLALVDAGGLQWEPASILAWINQGGRDMAMNKPKATTVRAVWALTANVTKQANPNGVIQVLELTANMGTGGATPGRSITTTSEDRLRAARPGWRADKGPVVRHLVLDDRDPGFYNVWPAPTVAMQVEGLQHKQYVPIASLTDTIPLDDSYRGPLTDYVLFCAYAMEGEYQNAAAAGTYYAKYASAMGIQIQRQKRASAMANSPENPVYPAVDKNGS